MKAKGYWVHQNSIDVFYQVLKVYRINPHYVKVKYQCWNKGFGTGQPWLCSDILNAKVMIKDLKNWRRYEV
jgi:hypothetical protein